MTKVKSVKSDESQKGIGMNKLLQPFTTRPIINPYELKVGDLLLSRTTWTIDEVFRISPIFVTMRGRLMNRPVRYGTYLHKYAKHARSIKERRYCVITVDEAVQLASDLRKRLNSYQQKDV